MKTPGAMGITTRGQSELLLIVYKLSSILILTSWSIQRETGNGIKSRMGLFYLFFYLD